jgi:hypothetical protein
MKYFLNLTLNNIYSNKNSNCNILYKIIYNYKKYIILIIIIFNQFRKKNIY